MSFLSICLLIFEGLSKLILPLSFCIALWDFYYVHLFFQDMKDDLNRIVDFLEDDFNRTVDFNTFLGFFSKFYKCFAYVFGQFAAGVIKSIQWNHNLELNCKYIYII